MHGPLNVKLKKEVDNAVKTFVDMFKYQQRLP